LIASLCDGRPLGDIAAAYRAALDSKVNSESAVEQGIGQLLALGIVRRLGTRSGVEPPVQAPLPEGENL
jgi:hypothetical protein